jgi:hypothetical protein
VGCVSDAQWESDALGEMSSRALEILKVALWPALCVHVIQPRSDNASMNPSQSDKPVTDDAGGTEGKHGSAQTVCN